MLEEQNDRRDGQLGGECGHKLAVNRWCTHVLETTRNSLQDLDRVLAALALAVAAKEPRGEGEDDDDEGVAERGDEEEHALCMKDKPVDKEEDREKDVRRLGYFLEK